MQFVLGELSFTPGDGTRREGTHSARILLGNSSLCSVVATARSVHKGASLRGIQVVLQLVGKLETRNASYQSY
jgi:hypothetical protein